MAKKRKLSKEDIKGPDAFISTTDKAIEWLDARKKVIFIGLVVVAAGALAKVANDNYQSKNIDQAETQLYLAKKQLQDKVEELDKQQAERLKAQSTKDKKAQAPDTKNPEYFAKNYKAESDNYVTAIKASGHTPALVHALFMADFYSEHKKTEPAIELLKDTLNRVSAQGLMAGLSQAKLGALLADKGAYQEAIDVFNQLLANSSQDFLFADALIKKALCHEKLGQKEQAIAAYEKVREQYADSDQAKTAATYLRLLNMQSSAAPSTEG